MDGILFSRFYNVLETEEKGSIQSYKRFYIKKLQAKLLKTTRVEERYLY